MSLYSYIKKDTSITKKAVNYFSYVVLCLGAFLLFWSFYPVVSFEIYSRIFLQKNIVSPLANIATSPLTFSPTDSSAANVYGSNLKDFTQANLWFPQAALAKKKNSKAATVEHVSVKEYSLSIPKLNIDAARVIVGGEDLAKGLIHYIPTSLPGEAGNVAIFGHSTLPQLYRQKDYKSIFTYLPQLERGDKVRVRVGAHDYEYEVTDMYVVKPENIAPIEQKFDGSYLTLVTCVPPGTYWNRLVLRAKLTSTISRL